MLRWTWRRMEAGFRSILRRYRPLISMNMSDFRNPYEETDTLPLVMEDLMKMILVQVSPYPGSEGDA